MHVQRPAPALLSGVPVSFLAFDVLHLDGERLLSSAYDERRAVLEGLGLDGPHWRTPGHHVGVGRELLAQALQLASTLDVALRIPVRGVPAEIGGIRRFLQRAGTVPRNTPITRKVASTKRTSSTPPPTS